MKEKYNLGTGSVSRSCRYYERLETDPEYYNKLKEKWTKQNKKRSKKNESCN